MPLFRRIEDKHGVDEPGYEPRPDDEQDARPPPETSPPNQSGESYLCGVCATPRSDPIGNCSECGSDVLLKVVDGYVLSFPAHTVPCPRCGSTERPLVFRGWVRQIGFVWTVRESRASAYVCRPCAERLTSTALALNALLGWWSIGSFFFYGWRALFHNWRAVWTVPLNPGAWGALDAAEFAASVRGEREAAFASVAEAVIRESPLRFLTRTQQELVLGANGLYELLGVSTSSSLEELRAAFRSRCKEIHPDLQSGSASATEDMIQLNNAWEILRSEQMRRAYDWLEAQRAGVPS
jgi:hypothetical protein